MVRKFSLLLAVLSFGFAVSAWAAESALQAESSAATPSETKASVSPAERERIVKQMKGLVGQLQGMPTPPEMSATIILPNAEEGERINSQESASN